MQGVDMFRVNGEATGRWVAAIAEKQIRAGIQGLIDGETWGDRADARI